MTESDKTKERPLWLAIEENFLGLDLKEVAGENREAGIQRIAGELDDAGYNVSRHGGNLLQLRWALDDMQKVGRPFLQDLNGGIAAFSLEKLADQYAAATKLIDDLAENWPQVKKSERRPEVIQMIEKAKLDLLVKKAKGLPDDEGIRLLIGEKIEDEVITSALDITEDKLGEVHAQIKKEKAERARVAELLEKLEGKPDDEKVKHLIENNVSEDLIIEMAKVDQGVIDGVKKSMEKALKEQKRLAEEAAAKKKAEAEGPSLENIPPDQMLEYIESIREIMEFSEEEKDIRVMCDQSAIPKALVDIAVSEPDKLDELEKKVEG
ncbi:MAG: hypothetical protein KJO34_18780 [Deltaproteobacteria bacterium]|nr:hypothetical protein [Deltaproteobacteria bacterium]